MMKWQKRSCLISAFCLSVSLEALAQLPPDGGPDTEVSERAREEFQVGVALLEEPDGAKYEEAYRAFVRAYRASPTWKILSNLGLSAMKLERFTDAIEAYERYLRYVGDEIDSDERSQMERDLRVMKATSARVRFEFLELPAGAERVYVSDTRARSVGGPIHNQYDWLPTESPQLLLAAGEHHLVIEVGEEKREVDVEIRSGQSETIEVSFAPTHENASGAVGEEGDTEPKKASPLVPAGWVTAGTGAALLLGGGVTAILGFKQKGDLNSACPQQVCSFNSDSEREAFENDQSRLSRLGTTTTILLAAGGVLAATGVTLILVGKKKQQREQVALQLTPAVAPTFYGLGLNGSF